MDRLATALASPAGVAGLAAAVLWGPATGFPTWPAVGRARFASTLATSLAAGLLAFTLVQRLSTLGAG